MGLLRLWLAIDVLNWHEQFSHALRFPHSYAAVGIFFVISGFYMALQLNTAYAAPGSLPRFYLNRILRLYPTYLLTLGVMAVLSMWRLLPPMNWGDPSLFDNLTLLPAVVWSHLTGHPGPGDLILGQTYTVGLELMFYAIAPAIVGLRLPWLVLVFTASIGLHFLPAFLGLPERPWQYEFFPSVLAFFIGGALSYRGYQALENRRFPRWLGYAAIPAILLYSWATIDATSAHFTNDPQSDGLYVLAAALLPFLFSASRTAKWDRMIGDISYPLYVIHVPVIWFVQWNHLTFFGGLTPLVLSICASILVRLAVERPIDKMRVRLRKAPRFSTTKLVRAEAAEC